MKKLMILSNVVLLGLLLLSNREGGIFETQSTPDHNVKLGVDPGLAKDVVANYKNAIWNGRKINSNSNLDSRSVWFSVYKLKKFIAAIEKDLQTNIQCPTDSFSVGIRLYFSVYPDDAPGWSKYSQYFTDHQLPVEYKGLHTVLMVPTLWNKADQFYYDFDPRKFLPNRCDPVPMIDVMNAFKNQGANRAVNPKASEIRENLAYMIMPDNLDSKRFFPVDSISRTSPNRGPSDQFLDALPEDPDFANGGTLIPPPYPEPDLFKAKGFTRFHVPSSGASFMRWVDGTNTCGWNTVSNGPYTPAVKMPVKLGQ